MAAGFPKPSDRTFFAASVCAANRNGFKRTQHSSLALIAYAVSKTRCMGRSKLPILDDPASGQTAAHSSICRRPSVRFAHASIRYHSMQ